jgi:hypothetical protein
MTTAESPRDADSTASSPVLGPDGEATGRYTGVVIIHGIGNQKRNATLAEALNALMYWFNHRVGLDLQPEGSGRIWLTTELRDDDDPDAPASHATLDVVAPANRDADPSLSADEASTQVWLEFREVWWAESFGLPKVGPALQWARVQFGEQLHHLLLPAGFRLGPAKTARRAPAREIAQALTFEPERGTDHRKAPVTADGSMATTAASADAEQQANHRQGPWLAPALLAYDLVQYARKFLQWVILTPLISLLLVLLGLVRLLARIPFLQSSLISGATAVINYVVLHWVASLQVYLLDYTRSSAMRQRFEREVECFLEDESCERIVVIAHSMGTVISYEGLTTLLAQPKWRDVPAPKPITYLCLAQALRRVWLLSRTDPERLHRVLPVGVRWVHFWARYDPVAVGPLDPDALPPPPPGASPRVQKANKKLRARLADCENVDVVNTDSIFADHTTYWQNIEQVVGPIARELVAGHPALERLSEQHLAPRAEVLKRRWRVAWRALAALAAGFGLAALLVALDASNGGQLGIAIAQAVGFVLRSPPVKQVMDNLTLGLYSQFGQYLSQCSTHAGTCTQLLQAGQNPNLIVPYLLSFYVRPENLATIAAALVVLALGIEVGGWLVAASAPFAFRGASPEATGTRSVLVLATSALLLTVAGLVVYQTVLHGKSIDLSNLTKLLLTAASYLWVVGLGELFWFLGVAMSVLDTVKSKRWGRVVGILAGLVLTLFAAPYYAIAVVALALVGCLVLGIRAARRRQWSWVASALVIVLSLGVAVADLLHPHPAVTFGTLVAVAPLLVYGLWAGPTHFRPPVAYGAAMRTIFGLAVVYLLITVALGLISLLLWTWIPLIGAAILGSVGAWGLALRDAVRAHRWGAWWRSPVC